MSRRRGYSLTGDPDFRYIVLVIGIIVLGSAYVASKNGIIAGIIAGLQALYNISYITIFLILMVGLVAFALFKWRIISEILIMIAKSIWKKHN